MRVSDIPEVVAAVVVAPEVALEVAIVQVEEEVALVAHPTTTTTLDMDHPLTVLLALPI